MLVSRALYCGNMSILEVKEGRGSRSLGSGLTTASPGLANGSICTEATFPLLPARRFTILARGAFVRVDGALSFPKLFVPPMSMSVRLSANVIRCKLLKTVSALATNEISAYE